MKNIIITKVEINETCDFLDKLRNLEILSDDKRFTEEERMSILYSNTNYFLDFSKPIPIIVGAVLAGILLGLVKKKLKNTDIVQKKKQS